MARVVYGVAARTDLERIVDYWLEHAPGTAPAVVARVRSAIEALKQHPLLGRRVEGELRELVISHGATGYLALYEFDEALDTVLVVRVRHQREAGYEP